MGGGREFEDQSRPDAAGPRKKGRGEVVTSIAQGPPRMSTHESACGLLASTVPVSLTMVCMLRLVKPQRTKWRSTKCRRAVSLPVESASPATLHAARLCCLREACYSLRHRVDE